jgi:hypothetical protein
MSLRGVSPWDEGLALAWNKGSTHERGKIVRLASPMPLERRKCQKKAYDLTPQVSRNGTTHPILTTGSGIA